MAEQRKCPHLLLSRNKDKLSEEMVDQHDNCEALQDLPKGIEN